MRALVRWLMARRLGGDEAERFMEELDELHERKRRSEGKAAGDAWVRKELRRALVSGFGSPVGRRRGIDPSPRRLNGRMGASQLGQDLRFGIRTLRRRPLFALLVVGTLGLGIGATTTVFSLVDGVLLDDMAYEDPEELVLIWGTYPSWRDDPLLNEAWDKIGLTWDRFETLRRESQAFSDVAGHRSGTLTLTGVGDPVRLQSGEATANLFPLLGVRPVLGRTFLPGEEGPGAPRLAVLGHELWETRFGSDPSILGRTVSLSGTPFEVIGVLPPGVRIHSTLYNLFNSEIDAGERAIWVPANWSRGPNDGSQDLETVGRIRRGVSREQALAEITGILPVDGPGSGVEFRLTPPRDEVVADHRSPLVMLLGASGLLLVIACANVATLLLGEAIDRRGEMATRVAMGAGRRRIARQLLSESLILGVAGGLVGMLLTPLGVRGFLALGPALPRLQNVEINQTVLLVAVATGIASALIFGFAPAVLQHRTSIHALLQREGRGKLGGGGKLQAGLLGGELALTMVLLVAAGVLGRSLMTLTKVDPGFDAEGVATVRAQVYSDLWTGDREARTAAAGEFQRMILDQVERIPGVVASGAIDGLPFPGHVSGNGYNAAPPGGEGNQQVMARNHRVASGYFETMRIPLLSGRIFQDGDVESDSIPPVLVNEAMAREFWSDESPIGASIWRGGTAYRVVGVVGDVRERSLAEDPLPMVYHRLSETTGGFSIVARSRGAPGEIVPLLREAVLAANPNVPVGQEATMEALVQESAGAERFRTFLVSGFGFLATFLALVGVFGVTARTVAHRNREMGIRMALGAENGGLVWMVVLGTLRVGGFGIILGMAGALAGTRFLSAFAFGTAAWDPWTYASAMVFLGGLCILSAGLAARRVTRVEPMRVLREE